MAAEAGVEMSGMEFSNAYGISPAFSSVTKTLFYNWATFTYEDGTPIRNAGSQKGRSVIAQTLLTQLVYAILDQATEDMRSHMRQAQPNFFLQERSRRYRSLYSTLKRYLALRRNSTRYGWNSHCRS
jgi:hypothetical protein